MNNLKARVHDGCLEHENDIGADVDNIVEYSLFNPYRPERSYNHDGE